MPNCDFYAFGGDSADLIRFVFSQPGWVLYELHSRPDSEIRQFATADAVLDAFDLSAQTVRFQLHAPEMKGEPHPKRTDLRPGAVPGASFWYSCDGWGLIQLYLEAPRKGWLDASHTNHNSEKRARAWESTYPAIGSAADWDWRAVTAISGRLNRYVRSRGVDKIGSRPVLPAALAAAAAGVFRLRAFGSDDRHS